jgi:GAF domain-containing protein
VNSFDASSFADIARMLEAEPDVDATVDQIAELVQQAVKCDFAGITLLHARKRVETAAATSPVVEKADALQYEFREGPCLQAIWSHDTFIVDDMKDDPRWPRWGPAAAEMGLRSILAVRLFSLGETHGALNLYASHERRFDEEDVAIAHIFATHASVALSAARKEEHLRKAVDARHLIGQAQGVLMERFDIDSDRAFDVLRRYSQNRNVKLRTIAQEVLDSRTLTRSDRLERMPRNAGQDVTEPERSA